MFYKITRYTIRYLHIFLTLPVCSLLAKFTLGASILSNTRAVACLFAIAFAGLTALDTLRFSYWYRMVKHYIYGTMLPYALFAGGTYLIYLFAEKNIFEWLCYPLRAAAEFGASMVLSIGIVHIVTFIVLTVIHVKSIIDAERMKRGRME